MEQNYFENTILPHIKSQNYYSEALRMKEEADCKKIALVGACLNIINDMEFAIYFPHTAIGNIFDGGRFKNMFEIGKTKVNKGATAVEVVPITDTNSTEYYNQRIKTEFEVFGITEDKDFSYRPIYGTTCKVENGIPEFNKLMGYGACVATLCKIKEFKKKYNCTISNTDSFHYNHKGSFDMKDLDLLFYIHSIKELEYFLKFKIFPLTRYLEIQVHGEKIAIEEYKIKILSDVIEEAKTYISSRDIKYTIFDYVPNIYETIKLKKSGPKNINVNSNININYNGNVNSNFNKLNY